MRELFVEEISEGSCVVDVFRGHAWFPRSLPPNASLPALPGTLHHESEILPDDLHTDSESGCASIPPPSLSIRRGGFKPAPPISISIDIKKRVAIQEHLAHVGQGEEVGGSLQGIRRL